MLDSAAGPAHRALGYRLLLPEDWAQVPLGRADTDAVVRSLVSSAFECLPADVPRDRLTPLRLELDRRLRRAVAEAREAGALELYLPVKLAGEVNLGASFAVSVLRLPVRNGDGRGADPAEVAVQLLAPRDGTQPSPTRGDGAAGMDLSSGELDGNLAVRRERVVAADPARGVELGARKVDYLTPVPGAPRQWMVVAFSTIGAGDPRDDLADAMVEWFDALMTTFRWSRV